MFFVPGEILNLVFQVLLGRMNIDLLQKIYVAILPIANVKQQWNIVDKNGQFCHQHLFSTDIDGSKTILTKREELGFKIEHALE